MLTQKEVQQLDEQYIAHTYARYAVPLAQGSGAQCRDFDGKTYIDFGSGIGVNSLGFCDPAWAQAVAEQARTLSHCSNYFATEPSVLLAQEVYTEKETRRARLESAIATLNHQLAAAKEPDEEKLTAKRDCLMKEQEELDKARTNAFTAYRKNKEIYDSVCGTQQVQLQTEQQYIRLKTLSDTANGMIPGKRKIELETYIQMTYFDRILRKANIRLMTMSSGQYELKRQLDGDGKREKAGLELNVIDHYNGTERSVKTLSGGESFQASLSLALGLSDEIQSYAGGIRLDAMFVDEGFGALDEAALDQALNALCGLTEGNRIVGIISHVSELKERIEKKIIVTRNPAGQGIGSRITIE